MSVRIRLGTILWLESPDAQGHEQEHVRPWMVVGCPTLVEVGMVIAVPLTTSSNASKNRRLQPWCVEYAADELSIPDARDGWALCHQVRALDLSREPTPAVRGVATVDLVERVQQVLAKLLKLEA